MVVPIVALAGRQVAMSAARMGSVAARSAARSSAKLARSASKQLAKSTTDAMKSAAEQATSASVSGATAIASGTNDGTPAVVEAPSKYNMTFFVKLVIKLVLLYFIYDRGKGALTHLPFTFDNILNVETWLSLLNPVVWWNFMTAYFSCIIVVWFYFMVCHSNKFGIAMVFGTLKSSIYGLIPIIGQVTVAIKVVKCLFK